MSAPNVTPTPWPPFRIGIISREDYDHARACVNFLAGVPAEKLDATLLERLLKVEAERDRLQARLNTNRCNRGHKTLPLTLWDCPECHNETRRQRDELLAALRGCVEHMEHSTRPGREAWEVATALLTKVSA